MMKLTFCSKCSVYSLRMTLFGSFWWYLWPKMAWHFISRSRWGIKCSRNLRPPPWIFYLPTLFLIKHATRVKTELKTKTETATQHHLSLCADRTSRGQPANDAEWTPYRRGGGGGGGVLHLIHWRSVPHIMKIVWMYLLWCTCKSTWWFCPHWTGSGVARKRINKSSECISEALALVWWRGRTGHLHTTRDTYCPSCKYPMRSVLQAFFLLLQVSCRLSRGFSVPPTKAGLRCATPASTNRVSSPGFPKIVY